MTGFCDRNLSNYGCNNQTYCAGPVNADCIPCREITEGHKCQCTRNSSKLNCTNCSGNDCKGCLDYYVLVNGNTCVNNFCTAFITKCANGHRCIATSVDRSHCIGCIIGQTEQCKCGDKTNCETCDSSGEFCETCLTGFEIQQGNCVIKDNICNEYGQNELCEENFYCDGVFGDLCKKCSEINAGQYCKCEDDNQQNCVQCGISGCDKCISTYAVQFGGCKLNTCGQIQNTLNCAFNYFCLAGSAPNTECVSCNGSQQCNCGTITGCKTCGTSNNTCGSCFHGFHLENDICVRTPNTCEENNASSNCSSGFFCNGAFGDSCISCIDIPINRSCQCDQIGIQNCTNCLDSTCTKCVTGMFPVNNNCVPNTCLGGQNSQFCAVQNYCPPTPIDKKITCSPCDQNSPIACNCRMAENCATCDETASKCSLCLNGFKMDNNICVRQTNICDSNQSSSFCDTNNFCDGSQGDQCISCENIKISYSCFCEGNLQQNCKVCQNSICKTCLDGFLPDKGTCQPNNCDGSLSNSKCQDGYICSSKTPGSNCSACVSGQSVACKCGIATNCTLCGVTPNTCSECVSGTKLNSILQCQVIDDTSKNFCDENQTSLKCDSNSFCSSNPGDNCIPCGFLTVGKNCNCDSQLQPNCKYCTGRDCQLCIDGFAPVDGICVGNSCGPNGKGCLENYYCPANSYSDTLCKECSFLSEEECKCGTAANCQTCSIVQNQCQSCIEGNFLLNGQCIPPQICSNGELCPINQYCQVDGTCAVCAGQKTQCSCDNAQNCQLCGIPGACINCIDGWVQDVNGSCSIPVCNMPPMLNQYCAGPNQNKQCPTNKILIEAMLHPCNCDQIRPDIEGCANCLQVGTGCKDCLKEYTMMSGICIFTPPGYTGSCDEKNGASLCISGMGCKNQGQCVSCSELGVGHECKCANDVIQLNCIQCDNEECKECNANSIMIDNKCREYCTKSSQCQDYAMCDVAASACIPCNGKLSCQCGESINCIQCNEKLQCNGCLDGYVLDKNGSCSICDEGFQEIAMNPIVCAIYHDNTLAMSWIDIAGCCFAIIIIIIAIIFVTIKCAKTPKRYVFQHNMVV